MWLSCGNSQIQKEVYLSISPLVKSDEANNAEVINVLEEFLKTKDNSLTENPYWVKEDFKKYGYPYRELYRIEDSRLGQDYYRPSLMEIININADTRLLKIAFIGLDSHSGERVVRCIYNILATQRNSRWMLQRVTDFKSKDWHTLKVESITYVLPSNVLPNKDEIEKQRLDIKRLCRFFEVSPIPITYYSCNDPIQLYELKGFDYTHDMYISKSGGLAEFGNTVLSANHSEFYTHEIVHIYTQEAYPFKNMFLDEGLATYVGGSGTKSYAWHRDRLKSYIKDYDLDFSEYIEPYSNQYINDVTPVPYIIGGLICERTIRLLGKDKLFQAIASRNETWAILTELGLNKGNISVELKKELARPIRTFKQES